MGGLWGGYSGSLEFGEKLKVVLIIVELLLTMPLSSSSPTSQYVLEQNSSYAYNMARAGTPLLRDSESLVNVNKHNTFDVVSVNYRIYMVLFNTNGNRCSLAEISAPLGLMTNEVACYLRELNKMSILRLVE